MLTASYRGKKTREFRRLGGGGGKTLLFFGAPREKVFIHPFVLLGGSVLINQWGNPGGTRGNRKGGGGPKKSKHRQVFFSRYLAANDGAVSNVQGKVESV